MATVDDPNTFVTDEAYEFSAPRFFDFIEGETEEEMRKAELWFDTALSYAPSRMSSISPFHFSSTCIALLLKFWNFTYFFQFVCVDLLELCLYFVV